MYRDHSVGVVVPAYNEEGFVGEVIETLPAFVDRVYAVDDRSTDGTFEEIRAAAERGPFTVADGSGLADELLDDEPADEADGGSRAGGAPTRSDGSGTTAGGAVGSPGEPGGAAASPRQDAEEAGDGVDDAGADGVESASTADEHEPAGAAATDAASAADAEADAASASAADEVAGAESASAADEEADAASASAVEDEAGETVVVPIRHTENRGVGGAIKTGYRHARAAGMDVTVVVGGDGQMDPDEMWRLLDPIVEGRADYAKGNRLLREADHDEMPRHRVVGNGVLTALTKVATGYWQVGDPQMGYTAISLDALEGAEVDEMFEYYGYCNDLLVRLSEAGYRVADVPCPLGYGDEESHIEYAEYVPRVSLMLLRSFLRRLWSDRESTSGKARLGLFLGGAVVAALGVFGSVVGALRREGGEPGKVFLGTSMLLLAMLVDAWVNAPRNYTEPVRDEDGESDSS